jgi:hypothetical protein
VRVATDVRDRLAPPAPGNEPAPRSHPAPGGAAVGRDARAVSGIETIKLYRAQN